MIGWLASTAAVGALTTAELLGGGRLLTYVPHDDAPRPSVRRLREDAETFASFGFRAVTTYATTPALAPACRIFKRHGFRAAWIGVADPRDAAELRRAIHLRRCADGYVVGSAGLAAGRYSREQLDAAIAAVRRATGKPVTTREWLDRYDAPSMRALGDWVFPIARGSFAFDCGPATLAFLNLRAQLPPDRPLLFETGRASGGSSDTTEHHQRGFLSCMESRQVAFAYWEAIDGPPAANDPTAASWGVLFADRSPKTWAANQWLPTLTVERTVGGARGRVSGVPRHQVRVAVFDRQGRRLLAAPAVVDRRGRWRVELLDGRPLTAYVVSAAWTAPATALDRLPVIDRYRVFALREVP